MNNTYDHTRSGICNGVHPRCSVLSRISSVAPLCDRVRLASAEDQAGNVEDRMETFTTGNRTVVLERTCAEGSSDVSDYELITS